MKFFLKLKYDGSQYLGYATQKHQKTIQDILELSLTKLNSQRKVKTFASSRTDTGVHACAQYVQFELDKNFELKELQYLLNRILPADISVVGIWNKEENFNVRYDVQAKTYKYIMIAEKNPFLSKYATRITEGINVEAMRRCCEVFVGTHDFSAFCGSSSQVQNKTRTIFKMTLTKDKLANSDVLVLKIVGNGFLYNMVRIIAGTLIAVGNGKLSVFELEKILKSKIRTHNCVTAPPQGLYLEKIEFSLKEMGVNENNNWNEK